MSILSAPPKAASTCPVPADCVQCGRSLAATEPDAELQYVPELNRSLCDRCDPSYIDGLVDEAATYALTHCQITAVRSRIDEEFSKAFGRTPGDVTSGQFTAFLLACRSRCTNSDDLVRQFANDRKSVAAGIFREAIERRIDDLLTEEAQIRGVAVPVESGRMPRTVFVVDPSGEASRSPQQPIGGKPVLQVSDDARGEAATPTT